MNFIDKIKTVAQVISGSVAVWHENPTRMFNGSKIPHKKVYKSAFDLDHDSLRDSSRAAYWDSSTARGIITRFADNVIGTGLFLEYAPMWELINPSLSDEEKKQHVKDIEMRFYLFANAKELDSRGCLNFSQLQREEYINRCRDGECFIIFKYSNDPKRMSPLNVQFLDPELIQTPLDTMMLEAIKAAGNTVEQGIEIDSTGKEIAIYVMQDNNTSIRIAKESNSGRIFVIHTKRSDTLNARRGTPLIAPILHEVKKIQDYTVAELEAANVNATIAMSVKPSQNANASPVFTGVMTRDKEGLTTTVDNTTNTIDFNKPGIIVQSLKAGESLESHNTARPNVNFGGFVREVTKPASSSLGMPIEILEESFSSNYSASKGSIVMFETRRDIEREDSATQFESVIFIMWLAEEIKAGRVNAPSFYGESAYIKAALKNHSWIGLGRLSIDPVKDANATKLRIEMGHTTGEREALLYNNSDIYENINRIKQEQMGLADASTQSTQRNPQDQEELGDDE